MTTTINVRPESLNLSLYAGDGFTQGFSFVDEDAVPVDMSGVWAAQVRETTSSELVIAAFAVDATAAATGQILISLTGDQVRDILAYAEAVWDLQQTATGLEPRTWFKGKVTAAEDVTRVV